MHGAASFVDPTATSDPGAPSVSIEGCARQAGQ